MNRRSTRVVRSAPIAAAILLGACATTKLDTARPITARGNVLLGTSLDQGGQRLNLPDAVEKLEANEKMRDEVRRWQTLGIVGGLMSAGGSVLSGIYLGYWTIGRPPNWSGIGVGVGLSVASIPVQYLARRSLLRAIDTHNAGLAPDGVAQHAQAESEAATGPPSRLRWTLSVGFDFGFREMVWAVYQTGERSALHLNDGVAVHFGIAVPYGILETELRAGIKYRFMSGRSPAGNDSDIGWFTTPLEVLEAVNAGPVRIAVGLAFHPFPMLGGTGDAARWTTHFAPAVGPVVEARYQTNLAPLRSGVPVTNSLGLRFEWLPVSWRGGATDGSAVGLFSQMAF